MKSKSTTEMDQRVNKSGLRTLEPLEAKSGQVLLLSTERNNAMKITAKQSKVMQAENQEAIDLLKEIRATLPDNTAIILGDAILHSMGSDECTASFHEMRLFT